MLPSLWEIFVGAEASDRIDPNLRFELELPTYLSQAGASEAWSTDLLTREKVNVMESCVPCLGGKLLMRKGIFSPDSLPLGFIFRRKRCAVDLFGRQNKRSFFLMIGTEHSFFGIRFVGRFRWKLHLHMFLFSSRFLVSLVVRSSSVVLNTVNSILFLLNCLGSMLV